MIRFKLGEVMDMVELRELLDTKRPPLKELGAPTMYSSLHAKFQDVEEKEGCRRHAKGRVNQRGFRGDQSCDR